MNWLSRPLVHTFGMLPMAALLSLTLSRVVDMPTTELDRLAQKRDVAGLKLCVRESKSQDGSPLDIIRTEGAYGVGRFGWHAFDLSSADGKDKYVVLGTPLTSEDLGEILLKREDQKLVLVPEEEAFGATIQSHDFDVVFDIPHKVANIVDTVNVLYAENAPASILFRMSPCYRVSSITNSDGKTVPFRQASGVVSYLRCSAAGGSNKKERLTVRYGGVVNLPLFAASISEKEATLVNDYWYPMIARGPASYRVKVHAPRGWTTVAQGRKLREVQTKSETQTSFEMSRPVVYFSLISAPFRSESSTEFKRQITTWSAKLSSESMLAQDTLYGRIMEFFSSRFGAPPYPLFGAVDSQTYGGGALEAYTFATWGGGLPMEDAHETAHTWWGGLINNTYLHSFWNESFAVYSDGLYHRFLELGNPDERKLAFISDGQAAEDFDGAAIEHSGVNTGAIGSSLGYGKGSKVLQMLEEWLGPTAMVRAMRQWQIDHPVGKPGEWPDFESVLAKENPQREIRSFFDDWIRRPGYAKFDAKAKWENGSVFITLDWKGPRFRMPLTVLLEMPGGQQVFRTVFLDGKSDQIELPSSVKPKLVSLDPWRQSVRMVEANESSVSLSTSLSRFPKLVDPSHTDWLAQFGSPGNKATNGDNLSGRFVVGSPENLPAIKPLCEKVGFEVAGNMLTYKGTQIDLRKGAALAVVDLPNGKTCVLGLGKVKVRPSLGRTRLILVDEYGRFLRGVTEPKITGHLTFKL